jgi:hypothetical protein
MRSRVSSLIACAGLLASVLSVSERTQAAGSGTVEKITVHGRALEGNLEGDSADRDVMVYLAPSHEGDDPRDAERVHAVLRQHVFELGHDR